MHFFEKNGISREFAHLFINLNLILNTYIDTINNFVGEKIINEVDEDKALSLNNDTFKFFEKLSHKINTLKECKRNCIFRNK